MTRPKFTNITCLVLAASILSWGFVPCADAQATRPLGLAQGTNGYYIPDYFGTPNWANSPPLQKFVDSLAPLGCATPNNLGQCIPIAVASRSPAGVPADGDYYEIALVQYREQMHSNLPPVVGGKIGGTGGTLLRGYVQEVNGVPVGDPHYLGPVIIATEGPPRPHQVHQPTSHRCRGQPLPARGHDDHGIGCLLDRLRSRDQAAQNPGRLASSPRTGPTCTCTAAGPPGSATAPLTSGSPRPVKRRSIPGV